MSASALSLHSLCWEVFITNIAESDFWGIAASGLQRYPPLGRGVQGVVSLAFSINRHGNVVSSRIIKSSGSALLDAEALDPIKRAAPLPPPPAEIADSELSFVVPIRFAAGSKR